MKSFKQFSEEAPAVSTASVVGTGSDVADWQHPKKRKRSTVSKHYIEVNGKYKKQSK